MKKDVEKLNIHQLTFVQPITHYLHLNSTVQTQLTPSINSDTRNKDNFDMLISHSIFKSKCF